MKLRYLLLLCLSCILCACSDDEPQRISPGGNRHDTEQGGDDNTEPDDPYKELNTVLVNGATSVGSWTGISYNDRDNETGEFLSVEFLDEDLQRDGYGAYNAVIYAGAYEGVTDPYYERSYYSEVKKWIGRYTISDGLIAIEGILNDKNGVIGEPISLTLEYRDGELFPVTPDYKQFILGKCVITDADGQIISDRKEELRKIWVHENGMNVLDFESEYGRGYQYTAPGSNKIDMYLKPETWHFNYISNTLEFGNEYSQWYGEVHYIWKVLELTPDKLVIKGLKNNKTDTYYAGTKADLPSTDDVMLRLTNPTRWKNIMEYIEREDNHYDTVLYFYEDGMFEFHRSNEYETSGTYKVTGDKIEMNFELVRIVGDLQGGDLPKPAGYHIDGFYDGQSRTEICPFEIESFNSMTIEIPGREKMTYTADFSGKWKVGH